MSHSERKLLSFAALSAAVAAGACTVYSEDLLLSEGQGGDSASDTGWGGSVPGTGGHVAIGGGPSQGGSSFGGSGGAPGTAGGAGEPGGGSGGTPASGGWPEVGGAQSGGTGGNVSGGGTGGVTGAGGAATIGGATGAGGSIADAGAAGAAGMVAAGGAVAGGGAAGAAGIAATGGVVATGGAGVGGSAGEGTGGEGTGGTGTGGTGTGGEGTGGAGTGGAGTGGSGTGGSGTGGSCSDTICGSECMDLGSSTDHCGACDRPCSESQVDAPSCSGGVCDSGCSGGWLNCTQPAAPAVDDGCETDGNTRTNDCGGCGVSCARYQTCNVGCHVPCAAGGAGALLVVGADPPGAADAVVQDWLESQLGFTVTPVLDANSQASDANGKALVVISSTCDSSAVAAKFTDVAVPIVTWEVLVYDDLNMTATDAFDVHTDQTDVDVVDPAHPLSAGLSGTLTIYGVAGDVGSGVAETSAAVVATFAGDASLAVLFAYDAGAAMAGGFVAPARRVGLPFRDLAPLDATEDAERLGLVAFCWAAGLYP